MLTIARFFAAFALLALPSLAAGPKQAAADYERLMRWQFSSAPAAIPAGGVTFSRDVAAWTLRSGSVRLMEPTASGAVTGLVFEGEGRFTMKVPDRFEAAQLRRFARKDIKEIDVPFTQLVLRTSDDTIARLFPPPAAPYASQAVATKRHEFHLVENFDNIDARIVAALVNPGELQMRADVNTPDLGWLTFDYDSSSDEEITLSRHEGGYTESWLSLDRAQDRRPDGRPGDADTMQASLDHIDVKADLTKFGRTGTVGQHNQRTLDGRYVVTTHLTGVAPEVHALHLWLAPSARDLAAFDHDGTPLVVLRDHIGKRSIQVDNRYYDSDVVVLLASPLRRGDKRPLRFEYVLETANFAPGRSWYPTIPDTYEQRHTARLELTVNEKNEVRSMGKLENRTVDGNRETTVWKVERPAKMVTFSTATRFQEVRLTPGNIPPVVSFGPDYQLGNREKVRNVGVDVANSMQFFQNMLGEKIDVDTFYVTSIAAGHGQAFDGFLHMSEFTYSYDSPGGSELFRAHEVAHEWWGHKVGWKSYRDQWLSEAFAEYSAMLFVAAFVKNGPQYYEEILDAYEGVVFGNLSGGFSKFARPWLTEFNPSYRNRLGPIGHGYRAGTHEIPAGYQAQAYIKGPLVLHMLRTILRLRTGNDTMFIDILRDFAREMSGKSASTDDFVRAVERKAGPGWGPFFASWVYTADLPTYRWNYKVAQASDGYELTLNVRRSGVADDFWTIIPLHVVYEGGKSSLLFIVDNKAEHTMTKKLPAKPREVVFGPEHSVLGTIRRD